jgi:hypothetical protein
MILRNQNSLEGNLKMMKEVIQLGSLGQIIRLREFAFQKECEILNNDLQFFLG